MTQSDLIIIGGGVVGLATAYRFVQRLPEKRVVVLEKEDALARHQTGRNSGVLHSGIYYKPGSLKAINCRTGKLAMEAFCQAEEIPLDVCGKIIVAVDASELPALDKIRQRGEANGVPSESIDQDRIAEFEPHARGVEALYVPSTGIVNYAAVCRRLAEKIAQSGNEVRTGCKVEQITATKRAVVIAAGKEEFEAPHAVNCGGLHSDDLALLNGVAPRARIIPFRGEYFKLRDEAKRLVRNLIYPVPDPAFPFLGVHFTRMINGDIECGPNAVFALAKEGYGKTTVNFSELARSLSYPGFVKLAMKHWRMGAGEMWRSFSKQAFVRALQRLVPEIRAEDLETAPAGVRAQAVLKGGDLVDDFLIEETERMVHVLNAPSPAATASLNIGDLIVERLLPRF